MKPSVRIARPTDRWRGAPKERRRQRGCREWWPLLLIGSVLMLAAEAQAHERQGLGPYMTERFEMEQGLPENSATAMVQTPDGFLWLGTFGGLVRYDGVRFQVYHPANTPGLPSEGIVNLHRHRSGALWCSTYEGLARFDGRRWQAYGPEQGWTANYARTFAEAPDGTLYVVAFDGTIWRLAGERFVEMPSPNSDSRESFGHCDPEGRLWVAKRGFVGFWDGAQWQPVGPQPDPNGTTIGAGSARDGGFWVITDDRWWKLRSTDMVTEGRLKGPVKAFWSLHERPDGEIWIASYREGLQILRPDGSITQLASVGPENGVPDHSLRFFFEDREDNLWVGTSGNGLVRLKQRTFDSLARDEGLMETNVKSIAIDPVGQLWIGTYGGGLFRAERERVVMVPMPPRQPWGFYVESVLADRDGCIWAGFLGLGAPVVRFQGLEASQMLAGTPQRESRTVLFQDARGRVWAGGRGELAAYDSGHWSSFPLDGVRALAEEPGTGTIWAATRRGLFRNAGDAFAEVIDATGRPYTNALCLRLTAEGSIWMGTAGDGMVLRRRDGTRRTVGAAEGLPVHTVSAMVDDDVGGLWLASDQGIARVRTAQLEAVADGHEPRPNTRLFTTGDGLPSIQCLTHSQPSAVKGPDGRIWFATQKGVAVVDPRNVSQDFHPPPVVITRATFLDRDGGSRVLAFGPQAPGEVLAGSSDITFEFSVLCFSAPEKVQCRCRLERAGRLVTEHLGPERSMSYELLPPGHYRLQVTAANDDGDWNHTGATAEFRVLPFLWQRLGFQVAAGVIVLGLLTAAAGYVIHNQRLENQLIVAERDRQAAQERVAAAERLAQSEAERHRAEEDAELRRQRESLVRDVHDGIGGIAANLHMTAGLALQTSDPAKHHAQLESIESLAREGLVEVRSLMNTLELAAHDFGMLAAELRRYGRLVLEPRGIQIEVASRAFPDDQPLNARLFLGLFRICKEAIANAAKHSQARHVRIELAPSPKGIRLVVADDGIGLRPDHPQGRGLRNMERRAAELGGPMMTSSPPGLQLIFEIPWSPVSPGGPTKPAGGPPSPNFTI